MDCEGLFRIQKIIRYAVSRVNVDYSPLNTLVFHSCVLDNRSGR